MTTMTMNEIEAALRGAVERAASAAKVGADRVRISFELDNEGVWEWRVSVGFEVKPARARKPTSWSYVAFATDLETAIVDAGRGACANPDRVWL
jgi:flavin-binding protein dodecin